MKSTTAIMQKTIDAVFEGFGLDEKGVLIETNKSKVAESDSTFKKFFLEMARDMWDEAEMAAGPQGIDAGINNIEFQQAAAHPAKMSFDVPTQPTSPQPQMMAQQPELNASAPGSMPGTGDMSAPDDVSMGMPPQMESLDDLFADIDSPDFDDVFKLAEDNLTEFQPMGNEYEQMQNGDQQEPGFGDVGDGNPMATHGMDQGMAPMNHSMGGDMGAQGMGQPMGGAPQMGEPGMGGDETMGMDQGMEFDFDLNTLGFDGASPEGGEGDEMMGGSEMGGGMEGGMGGPEMGGGAGIGGDASPFSGSDLTGQDDMQQEPGMNDQQQPPMESVRVPRQSKVAIVPQGKPAAKKAKPGLPSKN